MYLSYNNYMMKPYILAVSFINPNRIMFSVTLSEWLKKLNIGQKFEDFSSLEVENVQRNLRTVEKAHPR